MPSTVYFSDQNKHENTVKTDENPNIIHVNDRKLNAAMFEGGSPPSMYELLRSWVQDNPELYTVRCVKPSLL